MSLHEALRPDFAELIDPDAPVRRLATGFDFTEGPLWHPIERTLLFSDMPGDVRRRWDGHAVTEVARPSHKGNGLTYDDALDLIVCEHATSSLVRIGKDGHRTVLASHFEGRELNSPNDVCMRSDGSFYFSDPWYGRMPGFGIERPRDLGWQGVFRVPSGRAGGDPQLLVERYQFSQPNGLCFCPDESKLYVNDTDQANIRVFKVAPDGSLKDGRTFASGIRHGSLAGVPDGMKCDARGNVWVTAPGGLWVYDPAGRLLGKVAIPELAANLHWGGPDWRTLFVCASTSLYAVETKVGPRKEPFMNAQDASPPSRSNTPTGGGAPDRLDPARCALVIQDMQNDVVMDGGAFAASGSPQHAKDQRSVENASRLAAACRRLGVPVIHVWFVVQPGAPGVTLNAPLFEDLVDEKALVEGTWGVEPAPGCEAKAGDHIVRKMRMSAWEGTSLETVLKAEGRDTIIETGAWTNMSIEHTARTGADKGYIMVIPEDACSTMNADWHRASIDYAMRNVAAVTTTDDVIRSLGG